MIITRRAWSIYARALELELATTSKNRTYSEYVYSVYRARMPAFFLRAVESLGNGSTPLEANSENADPRLQLVNRDASGGRGV